MCRAGLDPHQGFLHVDRPGRPSLVLDLVEEFRAPAVDAEVARLVGGGAALELEAGGMAVGSRRAVAGAVLGGLRRMVAYDGRTLTLDGVIDAQARRVAAHVEGRREYEGWRCGRWV